MVTIVYDTHKIVTKLAERGFTEDQAVAITEALQELDLSELAAKSDLAGLEQRLADRIHRMTAQFFGMLLAQGALVISILQLLD